ncbi:hypothetical protein COV81_03180 [Candidatus Peregrinibacteria bacterium CG11_big_fil_rev_8_21_14_0_20_41_10]|nr:MAG: hypothetical protein COV81_03180 [Candidatus Peregrinibacteria bacterium CG11_big_fil_rev_8_21_14_0_20_41_10]PIZ74503.1 MAG: hypothetical protein COY06_04200 [Candidatus Peregrinibacteria bacterium CG_4_10_14_0_2_um_filter_41_8]
MTNLDVIENKISSIKQYLQFLSKYTHKTQVEIESDLLLRGALERYLYLVAQSTIDLAEAVIAYKKLRKPVIYREAFEILHEHDIIDVHLTQKLADMVGFRNIIAHDYAEINYNILHTVLTSRLADIELFVGVIEKKID